MMLRKITQLDGHGALQRSVIQSANTSHYTPKCITLITALLHPTIRVYNLEFSSQQAASLTYFRTKVAAAFNIALFASPLIIAEAQDAVMAALNKENENYEREQSHYY